MKNTRLTKRFPRGGHAEQRTRGKERTPTRMMRRILHAQRRRFHVLHLARNLGVLRIVDHHVSGPAAAGGEDVLLDGGRDEVFGRGAGFRGVDVACGRGSLSAFASGLGIADRTVTACVSGSLTCASATVRDISRAAHLQWWRGKLLDAIRIRGSRGLRSEREVVSGIRCGRRRSQVRRRSEDKRKTGQVERSR